MKKIRPITNEDILEFLKQAEILRQSKYLGTTSKSKVNITYKKNEGIKFSAEMPLRDDIEVILVRIRPFIEYSERLHVGRVITYLLKTYGDSQFLLNLQTLFLPESEKQYSAITLNDKKYYMRDLLIIYMYGKYLHLDAEKQAISVMFEKGMGPLAEYFGLSQIDKYVGIILSVAAHIQKNKFYEGSI